MSLYARELGASQAMVGVLASFYAVVPIVMDVYTGRSLTSTALDCR